MDLRLTYRLDYRPEETVEVVAGPFVLMLWERRYKTKVSALSESQGIEDLLYLAWEASRVAQKHVPATFDDFARTVVGLEIIGPDSDPTDPVPSAG